VNLRQAVSDIEASLRAVGRPERAAGEKRYLKSDLEFLGVSVPELRKATRRWLAERPDLTLGELTRLVRALWKTPVHELRSFGVLLLMERVDRLAPDLLELVEWMLHRSNSWAYVDALAVHVAGPLVERFPELNEDVERWAVEENFWLRRSALLALLLPLRRGEGDWTRFARLADGMLDGKEFFIRKAIGWVLREVSKKDPERVRAFVAERVNRISGVTLREAVKYLPEGDRDKLMRAYRRR
jgi:3-methyladenine DNA glycosylase AlkD